MQYFAAVKNMLYNIKNNFGNEKKDSNFATYRGKSSVKIETNIVLTLKYQINLRSNAGKTGNNINANNRVIDYYFDLNLKLRRF